MKKEDFKWNNLKTEHHTTSKWFSLYATIKRYTNFHWTAFFHILFFEIIFLIRLELSTSHIDWSSHVPYYIPMLHLFQEWNLSYCCAWYSLIFLLQPDFLQSNSLIRYTITSLVYHSICSLTNLLHLFVLNKKLQNITYSSNKLKRMSTWVEVNYLTCSIYHHWLITDQWAWDGKETKKINNVRTRCTSDMNIGVYIS